ncbi:MAG: c-type cytochrome [Candidatus Eiseniibacteriota bacterium]
MRSKTPAMALLAAAIAAPGLLCAPALHAQQPYPTPSGYAAPSDSLIPAGPLGDSIRRGRAILLATRDSLPRNVGNHLVCTNCHRVAGTLVSSGPWVGSYASFPQYNARAGRVIRIEDRINECLRRSLNGRPLADSSRAMTDVVSYLAFLSSGMPHGTRAPWLGYRRLAPRAANAARGDTLFTLECVRCHGVHGEGTKIAPPVWGAQSFAIGAGMSRINTAAAFIRWNMPFDRPASLTDQQAYDVAAFILSHARPDTPGKERDWPNGDPPDDAAYRTLAGKKSTTAAH